MRLPRRSFLKSGTLTAISAGITLSGVRLALGQKGRAPAIDFQLPIEAQKDPLYYYTRASFEPYVGSIFSTRGLRGKTVELTLTRVVEYKPQRKTKISTRKPGETDCFSLMFNASGGLPAYSNIPSLYHPAFGKLDMFLVSHGEVNGKLFYEAVFNRIC
jgi:hypothetical protein